MSIGSFDTHVFQPAIHARLLASLAGGLAELRRFAIERELWDGLLVVTYSEFGRRAAENRSRGTDHGAAAPQLVLGGKVKGGLFGPHPDLEALENGDVPLGTDYRRLLATVAERWWGMPDALPEFRGQGTISRSDGYRRIGGNHSLCPRLYDGIGRGPARAARATQWANQSPGQRP